MATKPTEKKSSAKSTSTAAKKTKPSAASVSTAARAASPGKTAKAKRTKAKDARPCRITGCKREYRAKGYCRSHYRQWRNGKFGVARYKTCNDHTGCRRPMALNRHGFCEEHFQNYYVKGLEVAHAPKPEAPKKDEKPAAAAG
jgi:hypothetical protein